MVEDKTEGAELTVFDKVVEGEPINCVKVRYRLAGVSAATFYNTLHDPDYRKTWDEVKWNEKGRVEEGRVCSGDGGERGCGKWKKNNNNNFMFFPSFF